MITDKLLDIFFNFLMSFLDKLPIMDVDVDLSLLHTFLDIVGTALYFFPWQYCLPILAITILLQLWRITITILKVIWQLLPFA